MTYEEYYDHRLFDPALALADGASFLSIRPWSRIHTVFNPTRGQFKVNDEDRFRQGLDVEGIPAVRTVGKIDIKDRSIEDSPQSSATRNP